MKQIILPETYSPADFGLAVYEKVQELTAGKSRRSARLLSAITCLELAGRDLPSSTWSTLVLFLLSDLAIHAPGVVLTVQDWRARCTKMAIRSGNANAQEMASVLEWASCVRRNIELESQEPKWEVDVIAVKSQQVVSFIAPRLICGRFIGVEDGVNYQSIGFKSIGLTGR